MPCTPRQSARFGVALISITGSSRPSASAAGAPVLASAGRSMMPLWSSPSCNSRTEQSMPLLSSPRILLAFSVMPVPGMKLPVGANTPFMPVRALGAPHTTWTMPAPVWTLQRRSRSALGCCTASTTWPTTKPFSVSAGLLMFSTSRPSMVSRSRSSASEASVSRCSLSQDRVNFIATIPSSPQTLRERGPFERGEAVMAQPSQVRVEEAAQVGNAVLQHGDAVDAHAEGEALVHGGIEPAIGDHVGMHHARTEDLQPRIAGADAQLAILPGAADIDLGRRLGKREVGRAEADRQLVDLEEGAAEIVQAA